MLDSLISGTFIPNLQFSKVISPTQLAVFLVKNIKASDATPPSSSVCCVEGAHSATGSPSQTYLWANYDTSDPTSVRHDIRMLSHELAEWLMDPRGDNSTPAWKDPQTGSCASKLEVGDPMHNAPLPPAIVMSGYSYHVQELAFFSWFFNGPSVASYGAGGSFTSNGTFSGPAPACP